MTVVLIGGLVTWLVTKIIVESEITRPLRRFVRRHSSVGAFSHWMILTLVEPTAKPPKHRWHHVVFDKVDYLLTCHLCTGVWVGLLVALALPAVGIGYVVTALAYKAVAHLLLGVEKYLNDDTVVNVHQTNFDFGDDDDDDDDGGSAPPDDPDAWLRHLTSGPQS
jgi:hypothetical protein